MQAMMRLSIGRPAVLTPRTAALRTLLAVVLSAMLLALLSGCGGGSGQSPSAPDVLAASLSTADGSAQAAQAVRPAAPAVQSYGVLNLGPTASMAFVNDRGQAAFWYFDGNGSAAAFHDGRRLVPLGSLGGGNTEVAGLNERGDVTGTSTLAQPPDGSEWLDLRRAFRWSPVGGMRILSGPVPDFYPVSQGLDINNRGQVAGYAEVEGLFGPLHAVRWGPVGEFGDLAGGIGLGSAVANAINDAGATVGYADSPDGIPHAMLWQGAGRTRDLGTLGYDSYATRINRHGEVIGYAMAPGDEAEYQGFHWTASRGITAIGSLGGGASAAWVLNDNGEVGGWGETADGWPHAILWSRRTGMVDLHGGPYQASGVADLNNHGEAVGWIGEPVGETDYVSRAVRFTRGGAPVDLTSRLAGAPATLVLTDALAVSLEGVILANSNAGLVMLRPGGSSDDAPVLGPVEKPVTVGLGEPLAITLAFTDRNRTQSHRAQVDWGDGTAAMSGAVREANGAGTVGARHRYAEPGFYLIRVRVTDSGGRSTEVRGELQVLDPSEPFVSGQGTVLSLPQASSGALRAAGPLRFTLHASGVRAGLLGAGRVRLDGALRFQSDTLTLASSAGQSARLSGSGRLNGKPGYRITIDVSDAGSAAGARDALRVRIVHKDPRSGAEVVDYDNARGRGSGSAGGVRASAASAGSGQAAGARLAQGNIVISAAR